MGTILAIEDVAFDRIILSGEILEDVVELNSLDDFVRDYDVVLGAEIDALLRFRHSADDAAGDADATHNQRQLGNLMRSADETQLNDCSAQRQKREIVAHLKGGM